MTKRALFARNREIGAHTPTRRGYNGCMAEIRRATFEAAFRLALAISAIAALSAVLLSAVGEVSTMRMVLSVAVAAFSASWVHTGRVQRSLLAARPTASR